MKEQRPGLRARIGGMLTWVRGIASRRREEASTDAEIRFHIDMETEKNVRLGMSREEARRRALVAFGGVERHREALRERRQMPLLEPVWLDLRFAARFLARSPLLSAVAALTVALGVGATATVFSALNALVLRPLPWLDGTRLASIQEVRSGPGRTGPEGVKLPYRRFLEYREATSGVIESLAAYELEEGFSLRLSEVTIAVSGALTSGNYFQTLGIRPALGRAYESDNAEEVVISHALWRSRFQSDSAVVGRTVGLDGRTVAIAGVAPEGFDGVTFITDQLWAPVGLRAALGESSDIRVMPLARLRDGVRWAEAAAAVQTVGLAIPAEENVAVHAVELEPLERVPERSGIRTAVTGFLGLVLGMAFLVLLIASANIAGVMLSRGFARQKELAVRLAIGAGRARLVRQLLAETLLIFGVGGVLGVGLAYLGTAWLAGLELPVLMPPVLLDLEPDLRVVAFAIAVTGATGVAFGLFPAFSSSRPELVPALKGSGAAPGPRESRSRNFFVGAQVTFAVMLLLTGALFARSLQAGLRTDVGFDPRGVVAATVDLGAPLGYDVVSGRAFYDALVRRALALPGVEAAALTEDVPLAGSRSGGQASRADIADAPSVQISVSAVSPGFFETLKIQVVAGRTLSESDVEGSPPVVVINQTLAERLWPGESPLGQMLRTSFLPEPAQVVGVAADGRYQIVTEEQAAFIYLPFLQLYRPQMTLLVRAPGAEAVTLARIREELRSLDADVAVRTAFPLEQIAATSLFPSRFAAQVVGTFGLVGLILGALGIYGVVSYQVSRRMREMGVRRALGATSARLVLSVVARGGVITAVGCALGMVLGGVLAHVARGLLFGIRPLDPVAFTAVPVALLLVALLASLVPARRAGAVQPSEALRSE